MGDVIDLSEKLKKRLLVPTKEDMKSYEVRSTLCEKNMQDRGYCDCDVCKTKQIIVAKVLEVIRQDLYDFSVKEKTPMFYADVIEILYLAIDNLSEALNDPSNS